jgi:hypothetical protein
MEVTTPTPARLKALARLRTERSLEKYTYVETPMMPAASMVTSPVERANVDQKETLKSGPIALETKSQVTKSKTTASMGDMEMSQFRVALIEESRWLSNIANIRSAEKIMSDDLEVEKTKSVLLR